MANIKEANSIIITYVSHIGIGSPNGSDTGSGNDNEIKKITAHDGEAYPYYSGQLIRYSMRQYFKEHGGKLAPTEEMIEDGKKKVTPKELAKLCGNPAEFIDENVFGYMMTKKKENSTVRVSPVRVSPLISITKFNEEMDFGTNFTREKPMPFKTEIHSGYYRGAIVIELDRIGCGSGFEKSGDMTAQKRAEVAKIVINSIKNLWVPARQSRFLTDISPKFVAAIISKNKNPVFLDAVTIENNESGISIREDYLNNTLDNYSDGIIDHTFGSVKNDIITNDNFESLKDSFDKVAVWVDEYYK